jgi:drug/metabolite transporter (DMT)-like permease
MNQHLLGQSCALLTAFLWAFALVLFKLSGERVPPVALNLYKNAVGLVLMLATLAGLALVQQDGLSVVLAQPPGDLCLLVLSGIVGIAIADTLFFHALNLIGVGLIAIVDCCYAPLAILCSWLLLGEQLSVWHYAGAGLIVTGVFTATQHELPHGRTRGQIVGGMLLAVVSIGLMALGIVIVKPILERTPVFWATTLRLGGGFVLLALFGLLGRRWRSNWSVFLPARTWRVALPASVLGTYVCLVLWVAGFKYTYASVAAALNQTSVIFASILAALVLKERYGMREVTALVLGFAGVCLITSSEALRRALS